ncbi:LlaJI family restriction endonuclease [Brevibacterium sp. FAM 27836]|uniref:LlaJI family restriction endonuclease n=1 Tax=Brevibacterium sp. FAM 27836 TaxID=3446693 RepID=UPI003F511E3D
MSILMVRELDRHSSAWVSSVFKVNMVEANEIIAQLFSLGVVKFPNSEGKRSMAKLLSQDKGNSYDPPAIEFYFDYVGLVLYKGWLLKCIPKYYDTASCSIDDFRLIVGVIEQWKYRNGSSTEFDPEFDSEFSGAVSLMLYLIRDYYEFGLYSNRREAVEVGDFGDVLWNKTIDESIPLISNSSVIYIDLYRRRLVDDEDDFIHRLHKLVLTACSKQFQLYGLSDMFDVLAIDLSDSTIDDFGGVDFVLSQIRREMNVQFETRKLNLLDALYAFISSEYSFTASSYVSVFGTSSFNLVWEEVCKRVIGDMLDVPLTDLPLDSHVFCSCRPIDTLRDIIGRPTWHGSDDCGDFSARAKGTLKPDVVSLDRVGGRARMAIFDAKYYVVELSRLEGVEGQPGVSDVSKQFLYQMAYSEFCTDHGIDSIVNCFLLPSQFDRVSVLASVTMPMFDLLDLAPIDVRLVPASKVFSLSLDGGRIGLSDLML